MEASQPSALSKRVVQTIVINPPHLAQRRARAEALCAALALERVQFSEGVSGQPHQLACALAHQKAMSKIENYPALILEDDLQRTSAEAILPPFPPDADLIYLSVTPFGCLPWTYENLALCRHRALEGLTLASRHGPDWLRLHSMSGGQAILYLTQKGRDVWHHATWQSRRFGGAFDVFTAYAMREVNVYAPTKPLLCESGKAQREGLQRNPTLLAKRLDFTSTPLRPLKAGERTQVHFRGRSITVEVSEFAENRLEWQVVRVDRSVPDERSA